MYDESLTSDAPTRKHYEGGGPRGGGAPRAGVIWQTLRPPAPKG